MNLPWAIAEMRAGDQDAAALAGRARAIHEAEVERCRRMAEHGAGLIAAGSRALTHCNTGPLATGGVGTALGAICEAHARGLVEHVLVDETRPLLQGARLTAWELERAGVPASVLADSAAGSLMARGEVDVVLTGADRIAANGDTANKIGTYPLAVLAAHHGIPFYVVAPSSTVDLDAASGADIPIEERDPAEVTGRFAARNPAFDVTPAALVTAIVTEEGVHRPPYEESLAALRRGDDGGGAMKAMVMAAGLGTRLRPLTDFLPKPMMPVANRPVLHHLLNLLRRHDVNDVGINLHAFPEMIQRYFGDGSALGMSILWSHEPELLGTAGGTKKLQDHWGDEAILITSGDGLHDVDITALLGHHQRTGALATLTVKPVSDPSSYGVVILDRDTRVRGFQEKPQARRGAQRPRQLRHLRDRARAPRAHPARHVLRLRRGRLAQPRRRRRGGLRVHDDGLLERRRRPGRAPQHDPRRRPRPRPRGHPRRGDRLGRLGRGGVQDRLCPRRSTARSCSGRT